MSTTRKGLTSFIAGETIPNARRVKLDPTTKNQILLAGATDDDIGVSTMDLSSVAAGKACPVQLNNFEGSVFICAVDAIGVNAKAYKAASGKVSATGSEPWGNALESSAADGDLIEALPYSSGKPNANDYKVFTVVGHNGAGNITLTGLKAGDRIESVANVTTAGDVTSGFTSPVAADDTLVQTSATDLSAKTLLVVVSRP